MLQALHDMSGASPSDPAPPSTSAQGSLLSGPSCPLHQVLGNVSVGQVVPSADSGPTQPYWSGSEGARISRKFSDPSPLKDDSAWIWGASAEPGLGPTVRCSVSKHQPKARLGMHKKGGLEYILQLRATVGKVSTPPPAPGFNSGHSGS